MNTLSYDDRGVGSVLVLLHGFCESQEIWNPVVPDLSLHFRVITPDLPGFGKSQILKSPFTIKEVGHSILELLVSLKIDCCAIVGHSLGGYVALAMAEERPDLINGFCLFHSTAFADSPEKKVNRDRVIDFVEKNGVQPYIDTFVPGLFYQKENESLEKVHQIASKTSKNSLVGFAEAMRNRPDMTKFISEYSNRILFVAGKNDSIIPLSDVEEQVKKSAQGKLIVMAKTGHMGMFEDANKTKEILKDFGRACFRSTTP